MILSQRCSTLLALQRYHTTALDGAGGKLTKEEKESLESPHFCSVIQKVVNSQQEGIIKSRIMPSQGLKMLVLPHFPITKAPDATDIQDEFLHFLACTLWHTAFPWLDSTKVKKSETFIKHLLPVFVSYHIQQHLLS